MPKLNKFSNISEIIEAKQVFASFASSKFINVYKILYKSEGRKIYGYLVEPKKGGNKLPCIVWNRGGSADFGALNDEGVFTGNISIFAKAGYVIIASQYSGSGGSEGKDEEGGADIFDVLNLYPILKKYKRADISRIGMYGGSRGGMMTLLALTKVNWVKAAVIRAPLTDMFDTIKHRPIMKEHYKGMFGGSKKDMIKRSPIFWVDKLPKNVPILMMHGTADWRVDVGGTLAIAKRMYEEKVPYSLIVYEGENHEFSQYNSKAMESAVAWFDRFVKNKGALPNLKLRGV